MGQFIKTLPDRELVVLLKIINNGGKLARFHIRDNYAITRLQNKKLIISESDVLVVTDEGTWTFDHIKENKE